MIESRYWREELRGQLTWLRKKRTFGRWSEKQMVLYERRLVLVAAEIRVLLDQHRVARHLVDARLECVSHRKASNRPTTRLNRADVWDLFAPEPRGDSLRVRDLCNQILHHYVLFAASYRPREFTHLLVFSDYSKNERLFVLEIPALLEFLRQYGAPEAGRDAGRWLWNVSRQDFDVS